MFDEISEGSWGGGEVTEHLTEFLSLGIGETSVRHVWFRFRSYRLAMNTFVGSRIGTLSISAVLARFQNCLSNVILHAGFS